MVFFFGTPNCKGVERLVAQPQEDERKCEILTQNVNVYPIGLTNSSRVDIRLC